MNAALLTFNNDEAGSFRPDSASPPSQDFIERLESRLSFLNQEIIKFSALAAKASDSQLQEKYWNAAREMGAEARKVREYLKRVQQGS